MHAQKTEKGGKCTVHHSLFVCLLLFFVLKKKARSENKKLIKKTLDNIKNQYN